MKIRRFVILLFAALLLMPEAALAQGKEALVETRKTDAQPVGAELRIQVVLSEYEGEKKIGSFPYTFFTEEGAAIPTKLRMGIRVPIQIAEGQVQYMDVGTNIDCRSRGTLPDGRYRLILTVDRSSVYSGGAEKRSTDWPTDQQVAPRPIVRQFRAEMNALLRDGQTVQATTAADPVSGRVLKVDVTLTVVK